MTSAELLAQLQATFPAGSSSGYFDASRVAGGEYVPLLSGLGIPLTLSLTSADGWEIEGDDVVLTGTCATPVLGVTGAPVYFQFSPAGDDFVLLLDLSLPQDWTFAQSFALLATGVFLQLRLAGSPGSALVVASGPTRDPLRSATGSILSVNAPLTFYGAFDVNSSGWSQIAWLTGGASGIVTGPVGYAAATGAVDMQLPLATGQVDHLLGSSGPSMVLQMSLFSGPDEALGQYVCGVRFDTVVEMETESGPETLDLVALLTTPNQGILDLTASGSALSFPTPGWLERWFGPGNGIVDSLPPGFGGSALVQVNSLTAGVGLRSHTLEYVFLSVGALTGEVWRIWPGVIEVGDLSFLCCVFQPLGDAPTYSFSFRGTMAFGNVPIVVEGRLPALVFNGRLGTPSEIPTVTSVLEEVFGSTAGVPDRLLVSRLDFAADIPQSAYWADLELTGSWAIPFGTENALVFRDLAVGFSYAQGTPEGMLRGTFSIGLNRFTVELDLAAADTRFLGEWVDEGDPLNYQDLAVALGMYGLPYLPEGIDLSFTAASFQLETAGPSFSSTIDSTSYGRAAMVAGRDASGDWGFIFGMEVPLDVAVSLTDIPVVGDLVPAGMDVIALDDLRIVAATTALPLYTETEELAEIFGGIVNSGLVLSVVIRIGTEYRQLFSVRFGGADDGSQYDTPPPPLDLPEGVEPPEGSTPPAPGATTLAVAPPAPPTSASPGPQYNWVDVQRAFGPVQFKRIGFSITPESRLALAIDGSVSLAGLTIALTGLSAEMPLESPYIPTFGLAGLAVEYAAAGLEIGGALVKVPGMDPAEYSGDLVLEVERFGALAFGSYTTTGGSPSLFAFVFLDAPLGGPGFFFVTGLAGGFGFNRTLRLPTIDTVATYPLVQGAMGTLDARSTVDALDAYIQPAPNEYWFAVGIRFTSYGLLRSYVLATVSFGATVEVGLMGESTLSLPPAGEGEQAEGPLQPLAEADLVLLVDVAPASGTLAVAAQLSPASYVLSRQAHLTGGFAFYLWFPPSPHAGDFVVSLGGYNPYFSPPAHYPAVPRLGFSWTLSTELSLTGGLYCALTPAVVMAGGSLKAAWSGGGLTAWFTAEADFLVRLQPFAYAVEIAVTVGVSYKLDLGFTTKTLSVQVSGEVELWGQPFGGRAWVDATVVSFSFDFGAPQAGPPADLDWATFSAAFLPPVGTCSLPASSWSIVEDSLGEPTPTDSLVTIHAPSGLRGTFANDLGPVWRVDPSALRLVVATQVPSKTVTVSTASPVLVEGSWNTEFGVGPMGVAPADVSVSLLVALSRGNAPDDDAWSAAAVTANVPAGVWLSTTADMGSGPLVAGVLMGIELVPVVPAPDATLPVAVEALLGDDAPVRAFAWSATMPATGDDFDQDDAMAEMQRTLVDPAVAATRASLLGALRRQGLATATTVDVDDFATRAPELMSSAPQLRLLGETPALSA
ncbi:MAG TPA: DUF6603 domain-containing protein [Longimicrobiaceae bacterium]|nr:DUF6603 domain-containing protein [Longimicrobiaceae bacterium]